MSDECVRCGDPAVTDDVGYCGFCYWAVRAEVEEGFVALNTYLQRWAEFHAWERSRGASFTPAG